MKFRLLALFTALFLLSFSKAQLPNTYLVEPSRLAEMKKRYHSGDADAQRWVKNVLKDANKRLGAETVSVMQKEQTPPSGTKHDYMSMAPYFWPDPSKPGGLPYMRKDGQHNPEIKKITNHSCMDEMTHSVKVLALAYYFSDDEAYAKKAADFLRVWYFDGGTKMNPNMNYAQAIKGLNDGRGIGIIESESFVQLINTVGLLDGSKAWTATDKQQLKDWFSQYFDWLLHSKNGKDEHGSKNNHGIWYDMQVVACGLYLEKTDFVKDYLKSTLARIPVQIETDGRQPLELARTNALAYSTFSLEAWFTAASLADNIGVDIWNYTTADGRGIKKAIDWLLPYAVGEKEWTYQQIGSYKKDKLYYLLLLVSQHFPDKVYDQYLEKIKPDGDNSVYDIFYAK